MKALLNGEFGTDDEGPEALELVDVQPFTRRVEEIDEWMAGLNNLTEFHVSQDVQRPTHLMCSVPHC